MRPFPTRRFFVCMAAATPVVIAISLAGELMAWSYGVSFAALALAGTTASLAALNENPLTWFRHRPAKQQDKRHA